MGSEGDWHRGWLIVVGLIVGMVAIALLGDALVQRQQSNPTAQTAIPQPSEVFNYHVKETVLDGERVHEIEFSGFTGKQIVVEHPAVEKVGEGRFIFKDHSFLQTVKSDRPFVSASVPYKMLSGPEIVRSEILDFYVERRPYLTLESNSASTWAKKFTIRGSVAPGAKVTVNGKPLKTTGSNFEYPVNVVKPGEYRYEFVASRPGEEPSTQTAVIIRPPDFKLNDPPRLVDTNLVTLTGTVNPAFTVKVNKLDIFVREDGSFDYHIILEEGKNTILVQAMNAQGQQAYSRTFYVTWEDVPQTTSVPSAPITLSQKRGVFVGWIKSGLAPMCTDAYFNSKGELIIEVSSMWYDLSDGERKDIVWLIRSKLSEVKDILLVEGYGQFFSVSGRGLESFYAP